MMANVTTNSTKPVKSNMTLEANATFNSFAAEIKIVSPKGKDSLFTNVKH